MDADIASTKIQGSRFLDAVKNEMEIIGIDGIYMYIQQAMI